MERSYHGRYHKVADFTVNTIVHASLIARSKDRCRAYDTTWDLEHSDAVSNFDRSKSPIFLVVRQLKLLFSNVRRLVRRSLKIDRCNSGH